HRAAAHQPEPDDAGVAALDADPGSGTFLPVSVSGGGIDKRMSSSFFGGGCGSSPLQPANNASGDNAQCSLMPPGNFTVFCTVVFSIALSTAPDRFCAEAFLVRRPIVVEARR